MTPQESSLISALFDRLDQTGTQHLDPEAARLIQSRVAANSNAAYLLTQSTLVLQQSITAVQSKIAALEKQISETVPQQGGFLSGITNLFDAPATRPPSIPPPIPQQTVPQGSGFLKGALATAAGVAGGALLFQGIENLLGYNPGAFGGMGLSSGGSFGENQPTEVINNYYEEPSSYEADNNYTPNQNDTAENTDDFSPFGQDTDRISCALGVEPSRQLQRP